MRKIDEKALEITTTWYQNKTLQETLTFEGINLGFLVEWEIFHYLVQTIKDFFMVEKIIKNEKPNKIIIFGDSKIIKEICEKHKIICDIQDSKLDDNKFIMDMIEIKYDILNHPISFKISFKKFLWLKQQYEKIIQIIYNVSSHDNKNSNQKNFLLLDFNPVTYKDFLYSAKENHINLKLLNSRRPAIWNFNSYKIIKKTDCEIVKYSNQSDSKDIKNKIDNLFESLKDNFLNDEIFQNIFSFENTSFWFNIKEEFMSFCFNRFAIAIKDILYIRSFLKNNKIDCILGWNDNLQTEKTIMSMARKMNIPIIILQHGIVPENKNPEKLSSNRVIGFVPVIAEYLATWGKITYEHAIKIGMQIENVGKIGSPRHDSFFVQKNMKQIRGKKTILFATSGLGKHLVEGFTTEILEKYKKSIEAICLVSKKFKEYELIVKTHPYSYDFIDVKNIIKKNNPSAKIIQNASMMDLIHNCDVLITFGQSTVLLEAMILEKPTISIWLYDSISPEEDIIFNYDAITVTAYNELENNLKRILTDKDFVDLKVKNGKKFVNDYLSNPGKASHELLKFLDNITNK